MDLVVKFIDTLATIKLGPRDNRIGVFGPYDDEDRKIIDEVMKNLSKSGRAAVTGDGYYVPDDPEHPHKIEEILPEEAWTFFDKLLPVYMYLLHFPRIVRKAIFNMSSERAQAIELIGCYEYNVPFLGFIIHSEINRGREVTPPDCEYLVIKNAYVECVAPGRVLCPYHKPARPFCPFYDSINVSWTYKQLFLDRKVKSRLIAVRDLKDIEVPMREFVEDP